MINEELQQLETKRDHITNKGYMMLLEQIPILAVPAFLAIFLSRKLAPLLDVEVKYTTAALLLVALFASWKFILSRLNKFNSELRDVSSRIRELKESQKSEKSN